LESRVTGARKKWMLSKAKGTGRKLRGNGRMNNGYKGLLRGAAPPGETVEWNW
jgi:hypothetical protein